MHDNAYPMREVAAMNAIRRVSLAEETAGTGLDATRLARHARRPHSRKVADEDDGRAGSGLGVVGGMGSYKGSVEVGQGQCGVMLPQKVLERRRAWGTRAGPDDLLASFKSAGFFADWSVISQYHAPTQFDLQGKKPGAQMDRVLMTDMKVPSHGISILGSATATQEAHGGSKGQVEGAMGVEGQCWEPGISAAVEPPSPRKRSGLTPTMSAVTQMGIDPRANLLPLLTTTRALLGLPDLSRPRSEDHFDPYCNNCPSFQHTLLHLRHCIHACAI